ncbi:extracellular matrix protein 3 [Caerostris extrusa]|uniref:Extracellular matrix protein 3 n=1 Tax=Caerostris extrusa TaxID=172846 RepID=A0AAV4PKJ4_CAEEX|nr:extracellular matrix protein 3 [Caerostris extrusa]
MPVAQFSNSLLIVIFKKSTENLIPTFTVRMSGYTKSFQGDKAGGFKLQLNDGVNFDSPHVFITARVLRIILATNEKLSILPRMQQSITKDHLFVTTNDHDFTRVIDFTITHGPDLGRLLVENPDGSVMPISGFTQEQVNRNLVLYEHNKPMIGLKSSDVIRFDIETQNAETLKDVEFHIEISVGNFGSGNLDQLVVLHTLEVKEGGMAVIGQEHVDMSRLFSLWQGKGKSEFAKKLKIVVHAPPVNGWIETESGNSSYIRELSFNREDIRKKRVRYFHDDSDTFSDSFTIGFYLLDDKGNRDVLLFNGTVNIIVYPVNDNPFVLLTPTAVIKIVQGQSFTLGPSILNVTDADDVPKDIVYEIIKSPHSGKLIIRNISISNFTQEDINNYLVQYVHDGTNENRSAFSFKVSDGKHKPGYAALDITIVPIKLHLKNVSAIEVLQGSTAAFLSSKNLGAETNADNEDIWYNITSLPLHGHIFVTGDATRFRQIDINNGKFTFTVKPSDIEVFTTIPTEVATVGLKPQPPPAKPDITRAVTTIPETSNGELQQPSISNDHLLIAGIVLGIVIVCLIIIIVVKCRSIRNERNKERTNETYFGQRHGKNKTVAGSHTAQSDLDLSDHNHSNGSISLSDDIPPPPPPPHLTFEQWRPLGCIGSRGTSKNRTLKKRGEMSGCFEPLFHPPPYILENGEWTEINVPLPTCKVTPIPQGDEINETALKGPYLLRDPSEGEDWSNYEGSELRFGPACNPVLRKNQYWV